MTECFDELVANSLHWFDKSEKKIKVIVEETQREKLHEKLDKTKNYLKIHFEDNGKGIEYKDKENIFAPFYTSYLHGTGLGLSFVQRIIEGHESFIEENGIPEYRFPESAARALSEMSKYTWWLERPKTGIKNSG